MDKFYEAFKKASNFVSSVRYFYYLRDNVSLFNDFQNKNTEGKPIKFELGCKFPSEVEFEKEKYKAKKVTTISAYVQKHKEMRVREIAFVGFFINFYAAFGYANTIDQDSDDEIYAKFLYTVSYVYNSLKLKEIPYFWKDLEKIVTSNNFKNVNAASRELENPDSLAILSKIHFKDYFSFTFKKGNSLGPSFEEQFGEGLVMAATEKIEKNIVEYERKEHPVQTRFFNKYPFFASMASLFELETRAEVCRSLDIQYGAIDVNNRKIYLNTFNLNNDELLDFVFAHEMLHASLKHAARKKNREHLMWNLACDFVINQWLVEMKVGKAPDGIFLDSSLAGFSAEEIYEMIKENSDLLRKMMTMKNREAGHKYKRNKNKGGDCDMFNNPQSDSGVFGDLHDAAAKAMLQGYDVYTNMGRGNLPAGLEEEIRILQQPAIPWEVELATWISQRFPDDEKKRTYSRVSRRPSITADIPMPSWKVPFHEKSTRTFGVILDTSGSMDAQLLGKCLGAIAAYAKLHDVMEVRLICCDTQPYDVGYVKVDDIKNRMKVYGRGGTVLQPAMDFLEIQKDFPKGAPVLVLTDGYFEPGLRISRNCAFLVPDKRIIRGYRDVFEFS